jgi:tetratricopeptide (TPR) repeat protein
VQNALFDVYYRTGILLGSTGDAQNALAEARRAFALAETLARLDPEKAEYKEKVSASRRSIAENLTRLGDYKNALVEIRAVRAEAAAELGKHPENVAYRYELWAATRRLGSILAAAGQNADALENLQTALEIIEKLSAESPLDDGYRRNTSFTLRTTARILINSNQPAKALPQLRRALALSEELIAKDPDKGESKADLAEIHAAIGNALTKLGKLDEGLINEQKSLQLFADLLSESDVNAAVKRGFAETLLHAAETHLLVARRKNSNNAESEIAEAVRLLRQSHDLWTEMRQKNTLARADFALAEQTAARLEQTVAAHF